MRMSLGGSGGTSPQKVASIARLAEVPREAEERKKATQKPPDRRTAAMAAEPASTSSSASPTPAEAAPSSASMGTVGLFAPITPEPTPSQSGSAQGTAAVVSLVASHVESVFPKTTFEVYSQHADVIHIAWKGAPQTDEVRSYLQTLRLQGQIPNVDFNFHHTDPGEPSGASASGGKDHVGEYLATVEPLLKKLSVDSAVMLEALGKTLRVGDGGEEEAVEAGARNLERSITETKGLVDVALEKCGLLKTAEVPLREGSLAELRQMMKDQVIPSYTLLQKECIKFVNARVSAIKVDAVQVLRQLDYPATEARKAVDAAWEKYGPMETAAEVVRRVFEKGPPRP